MIALTLILMRPLSLMSRRGLSLLALPRRFQSSRQLAFAIAFCICICICIDERAPSRLESRGVPFVLETDELDQLVSRQQALVHAHGPGAGIRLGIVDR